MEGCDVVFIRRRSSDAPSDSLSRLPTITYIHTYATLIVGLFIQFSSFQLDEARLLLKRLLWCSPSSPHPLPQFANWHTFTMSLHPRGLPTYLSSIYVHFSEGFSESRTAAPSENPHLPLPRRRRDAAFGLRPWLTTRVRRKPFVRAPSGGWPCGGGRGTGIRGRTRRTERRSSMAFAAARMITEKEKARKTSHNRNIPKV